MEAYRTAYVYVRETFAGTLKETDYGYSFQYDKKYLENQGSTAVIPSKVKNLYPMHEIF